jgi:hypothetical protein
MLCPLLTEAFVPHVRRLSPSLSPPDYERLYDPYPSLFTPASMMRTYWSDSRYGV